MDELDKVDRKLKDARILLEELKHIDSADGFYRTVNSFLSAARSVVFVLAYQLKKAMRARIPKGQIAERKRFDVWLENAQKPFLSHPLKFCICYARRYAAKGTRRLPGISSTDRGSSIEGASSPVVKPPVLGTETKNPFSPSSSECQARDPTGPGTLIPENTAIAATATAAPNARTPFHPILLCLPETASGAGVRAERPFIGERFILRRAFLSVRCSRSHRRLSSRFL